MKFMLPACMYTVVKAIFIYIYARQNPSFEFIVNDKFFSAKRMSRESMIFINLDDPPPLTFEGNSIAIEFWWFVSGQRY